MRPLPDFYRSWAKFGNKTGNFRDSDRVSYSAQLQYHFATWACANVMRSAATVTRQLLRWLGSERGGFEAGPLLGQERVEDLLNVRIGGLGQQLGNLGLDELARQRVRIKLVEVELERIAHGTRVRRHCSPLIGWAGGRPRRCWPGLTSRAASNATASAATSAWCPARTQAPTATGWATSPAKGPPWHASCWSRRLGRPCVSTWSSGHSSRLMNGDPDRNKLAIVGVAHTLLRQMQGMLKHNAAWQPKAA